MLEFSDEKVVATIQVPIQFTENDIDNIIVTAIEGGCKNWMGLIKDENYKDKPKDEPLSQWTTKLLLEGKTIHLYDVEDREEKFELTLEKLIKGIQLNCVNRPDYSDKDNWDADDCDCIMQYALFGEIVYC